MYQLWEIQGKGVGALAQHRIPVGTRILSESALLVHDASQTPGHVYESFKSLGPEEQEKLLQLASYSDEVLAAQNSRKMLEFYGDSLSLEEGEECMRVSAIVDTNAFFVSGMDKGPRTSAPGVSQAIFLHVSRLNHSCVPNVHWAYNVETAQMTCHANREIQAGEELTIDYVSSARSTSATRRENLMVYGFECTCPACKDPIDSDRRREELAELECQLLDHEASPQFSSLGALDVVRRVTQLLVEENIRDPSILGLRYVPRCFETWEPLANVFLFTFSYERAAFLCVGMGLFEVGLVYARSILEAYRSCLGEDNPEYREKLKVVRQLELAIKAVDSE